MDILHPSFFCLVRAARALLGWSQQDLASQSGVSLSTLNRLERGGGDPSVNSLRLIHKTFEQTGIQFITEPNGTIGVTLARQVMETNNKL